MCFFFTKLTATEMLYVLHIDKPMQSQSAPASVGHWGHPLPMSFSFGTELPFRLRNEHSDRSLSNTLFRSTFALSMKYTQGVTLVLDLQAYIFRRPSPSKALYPLSMVSHWLGLHCPLMETPSAHSMVLAQVVASKDRCEEGNESILLMCVFIHSGQAEQGREDFSFRPTGVFHWL